MFLFLNTASLFYQSKVILTDPGPDFMTKLLIPLFESKDYAFSGFFYQGLGVVLIPLTFTQMFMRGRVE